MEIPEQFFTVHQETWLFLGSCLLGIPLGLLTDALRLLRCLLPHHGAVVFLEDMLVVCAGAVLVQCYVILFARSELRCYDAVGCICGFVVYCCTVGAVFGRMLRRIRLGRKKVMGGLRNGSCRIWQKICPVFVRSPENKKKSLGIVEKRLTE